MTVSDVHSEPALSDCYADKSLVGQDQGIDRGRDEADQKYSRRVEMAEDKERDLRDVESCKSRFFLFQGTLEAA